MKKIIRLLRGFTRHMTKSNVNAHASCAAYFMFLSLIPIIILLCSLLPYTSLEKSDLLRGVAQVMPMPLVPVMSGLIDSLYNSTVGVTSVAAVVTVWSAGKGMLALIRYVCVKRKARALKGRRLPSMDERYLKAAQEHLYTELSISMKVSAEEIRAYVESRLRLPEGTLRSL